MIGTYYRLSLADEDVGADKAESNSIQGQRGLVEGYIMARPELAAEPRQEYVDDGYSGTSTSRPAFQRLIQDAQDICVLQRKDRKAIAITPCAAEHPMSFKVPGRLLTDGQCRMMINGIQFIQVLLEANGLAAGKDHQFKGRYDAEKNAVIISLEKDEQSALSPQKCTT